MSLDPAAAQNTESRHVVQQGIGVFDALRQLFGRGKRLCIVAPPLAVEKNDLICGTMCPSSGGTPGGVVWSMLYSSVSPFVLFFFLRFFLVLQVPKKRYPAIVFK